MGYIYHSVPNSMIGETLFPLSILKRKNSRLYSEAMEKYGGRKYILKRKVPFLNCSWSEVIFLSPVHPRKIALALKFAGKKETEKRRFYKINPKKLDPEKTIIYLYKYNTMADEGKKDNFAPFSMKKLQGYDVVPGKTIKYYKKEIKDGRKPLLYHFIPHIVYRGEISVKDAEIVEVGL